MQRLASWSIVWGVVFTVGMGGCGGGDSKKPVKPLTTPPAGVTAAGQSNQVTVDWTDLKGAKKYNVYWGTSPGVTPLTGNAELDVSKPFVHVGLVDGQNYYYIVAGENKKGEGPASAEVFAQPIAAPTNVLASPGSLTVSVTWNAVATASSYNVYWSNSPFVTKATGTLGTNVLAPATIWDHDTVTNGEPYYYVVTALNTVGGGGESAESTESGATPNSVGVLDNLTFGFPNGYVVHDGAAGGAGDDLGLAITEDSAGNLIVVGTSENNTPLNDTDMVIWRYDETGALDASFGASGIVIDRDAAGGGGSNYDAAESVVVDSLDRIVVGGFSENANGNADMVLWRYNSDGSLDTTFDQAIGQGIIVHDNAAQGQHDDFCRDVILDRVGRILVAGSSARTPGNNDLTIWRYRDDGRLDSTFGFNGIVTHNAAAGYDSWDEALGIAIDSSDRIVAVGYSDRGPGPANFDMVIWRFTPGGRNLDDTFNPGGAIPGVVVHGEAAGGNGTDRGEAVAIDGSGNIVVAGSSENITGDLDMVVWRFDSDGNLDPTFNASGPTPGVFVHDSARGGSGDDVGADLSITSAGSIYVVGSSDNSTNSDMVVWRLGSDGTLDDLVSLTPFGPGGLGFAYHDDAAGGNGNDDGFSLLLDSLGRIVVAGSSSNGPNLDLAIWRFQ